MLICIKNLVKLFLLVLKILSGNKILRSIKGRNIVANLRNLMLYNHNLVSTMLMCIQNLVKFYLLVLKILSGNEILRSVKGRNTVANLRIFTLYNINIDIINVNVYTKFG